MQARKTLICKKNIPWFWGVVILLMAVDAVWLGLAHLSIPLESAEVAAAVVGGMLALTFVYSRLRPDERLAALAESTAKLFAYSVSLAVFGYLTVTLRQPLVDDWLASADRAAGFDWPAVYAWVGAHPVIREILIVAYDSLVPQIGILMTLMITLRRYDRVRTFLWLYVVSSLAYVSISAVLPAAGAFGHYRTALDTPYLQQFYALRSGDMRILDLMKLQGVVQFPSFHLALAVLCTYVTRGIRFLFPLVVTLNLFVIAATPAIGGHFFADLWTSALLVSVIIFVVERRLCGAAESPEPDAHVFVADAE